MATKNPKSKTQNSGFTLIELIIYLAIVSIILVSISYLTIDLISGQSSSQADQELIYGFNFITATLIKDIRLAQDITSLSSGVLALTMPGDDVTYSFDLSNKKLTRQIGAAVADLHSDAIEVTGSFSDRSYLGRAKNVGVDLSLNYINPDNLPQYNASTTASFSVELRGRR